MQITNPFVHCFASCVTIAAELSVKVTKRSFPIDQAVEKVADIYEFPGTWPWHWPYVPVDYRNVHLYASSKVSRHEKRQSKTEDR